MPNPDTVFYQLRPLEPADVKTMEIWFRNVADLACFDRSARTPVNSTATERAWNLCCGEAEDARRCWFAIEDGTGELCGIAGLENISPVNRDAVIAVFIGEGSRRQGIAIRAVGLLLDFAFRQIGLNRVTSFYRADNTRSMNLTARAGFTAEGRMREAWFAEGRYFDMIAVGLLQEDWSVSRMVLGQELDPRVRCGFGSAAVPEWIWPPDLGNPSAGGLHAD